MATKDARTRDRDARTNSANAVTTAYTQAMEQLGWTDTNGDPVLGGRLSGVYALEKIAQYNEEYREQIIKVLTGYVRQHAPVVFYVKKTNSDFDVFLQNYEPEIEIDPDNPKHVYAVKYKTRPREDIQAVFDVFSGVKADWVNKTLDPHRGYLNFSSSHLGGILFQPLGITCSFHCSTLMKASLKRSRFGAGTVFIDSNLAYAHFDEAELHGCEWSLTNLDNTYFISAKLSKAEGLIRDQLKTAVLTGDFEWLDEHDNED